MLYLWLLNQLKEGEAVGVAPGLCGIPQSGVVIVSQVLSVKREVDAFKAIGDPVEIVGWEMELNTNLNGCGVGCVNKTVSHNGEAAGLVCCVRLLGHSITHYATRRYGSCLPSEFWLM